MVLLKQISDEFVDFDPLFEMIFDESCPAKDESSEPLVAQPFNLAYDNSSDDLLLLESGKENQNKPRSIRKNLTDLLKKDELLNSLHSKHG